METQEQKLPLNNSIIDITCDKCPLQKKEEKRCSLWGCEATSPCIEGVVARIQRAVIIYGDLGQKEDIRKKAGEVIWTCICDLVAISGKCSSLPILDRHTLTLKKIQGILIPERDEKLIEMLKKAEEILDAVMVKEKEIPF